MFRVSFSVKFDQVFGVFRALLKSFFCLTLGVHILFAISARQKWRRVCRDLVRLYISYENKKMLSFTI